MDPVQTVTQIVSSYADLGGCETVNRALAMASQAHAGHHRKDKNPYIQHAIGVAAILAQWQAPAEVVAAGLLHDVFKEKYSSRISLAQIREHLSDEVANLVEDVSQLSDFGPTYSSQIPQLLRENEELICELPLWVTLAIHRNPIATVIKIADRLHNSRSLDSLSPEKRSMFAATVLNVFVPVAEQLGMAAVKRELEAKSLLALLPDQYHETMRQYEEDKSAAWFMSTVGLLRRQIANWGLEADVQLGPANLYALYRGHSKANNQPHSYEYRQPIQIITRSVASCYQALGIVYEVLSQVPHDLRDYIGDPKPNGYRALIARAYGESKRIVTVVIQTRSMNLVGEYGLAAKWLGVPEDMLPTLWTWSPPPAGKIVVFTPKGKPYQLPEGATPIDFAYAVHIELGNRCTGAAVNGREVLLHSSLRTGDVVRILVSGTGVGPNPQWLSNEKTKDTKNDFVKTRRARSAIRRWLEAQKPEAAFEKGQALVQARLVEQGTPFTDIDFTEQLQVAAQRMGFSDSRDLLIAVGLGQCSAVIVISHMPRIQSGADDSRLWQVATDIHLDYKYSRRLGKCCQPEPPDAIVGYVTKRKQLIIHRADCVRAKRLSPRVPARWNPVPWQHRSDIEVSARNRVGLARDISVVMSDAAIDMTDLWAGQLDDGTALCRIGIGDMPITQVEHVLRKLGEIKGVRQVRLCDPNNSAVKERSLAVPWLLNPYTLNPARGNNFIGRQNELSTLFNNLLQGGNATGAVLLWGPRRIGKTSLLLKFESIIADQGFLPVYIDMQGVNYHSTTSFLFNIAEEITKKLNVADITTPPMGRISRDPIGYFHSFIKNAVVPQGRRIVIIIDEFELINELAEEAVTISVLCRYLRSLIQHPCGISIVFSGGGVLDRLLLQQDVSAMLEVAHQQRIGCLAGEEARKLIIEPINQISHGPSVVEELLALTAHHPYFIHMLCGQLISEAIREGRFRIDIQHLNAVLTNWLPEQGEQPFNHLWGSGSVVDGPAQRLNKLVLIVVALSVGEQGAVSFENITLKEVVEKVGKTRLWQALEDLVKMETLVRVSDGRYRIKVKIFERWLCGNFTVERALREYMESK
ncbi:MAG: HD domain-containing protein [Chloroflexi bacterium]|nr:HD domain-containing protein [Chloroflexota bacterium]